MSKAQRGARWIQIVATLAVIALFVADTGLDILAKEVPLWVYPVLGLLALGVEAPALGRFIMAMIAAAVQSAKGPK